MVAVPVPVVRCFYVKNFVEKKTNERTNEPMNKKRKRIKRKMNETRTRRKN